MNTIKRNEDLVIAKTYYSKKSSYSIGILLIVMGVVPLVVVILDPSSLSEGVPFSTIPLVTLVFACAGFFMIYPAINNSTRPRSPLTYDPKSKGLKMIYGNILGAVFVGLFLSIFFVAGFADKEEIAKYILWLFIAVFGLMFSWRIGKGFLYMSRGFKFGVSKLNAIDAYTFGDTALVTLTCRKLKNTGPRMKVTLRNLTEHPGYNSNNKDASTNGFLTELHYERKWEFQEYIRGSSVEIDIPTSGKSTDYVLYQPTYWELTFESEEEGYFSRFFLNVR